MTTGERLVAISTLVIGTALEHFLNISTGTGGETIYVERLIQGEVAAASISGEVVPSVISGEVRSVEFTVDVNDVKVYTTDVSVKRIVLP